MSASTSDWRLAREEPAVADDLADAGMTLRCPEAWICVGETVVRSIGSTIAAAAERERLAARESALPASPASPSTAVRNAFVSGSKPQRRLERREPLDQRRGLDERVVARCPASRRGRSCRATRSRNGELAFSAVAQR